HPTPAPSPAYRPHPAPRSPSRDSGQGSPRATKASPRTTAPAAPAPPRPATGRTGWLPRAAGRPDQISRSRLLPRAARSRCKLLEDLLPRQLPGLVPELIETGLLVNEDLVRQRELLALEKPGGEDVLAGRQQAIEQVRPADPAKTALGPIGGAEDSRRAGDLHILPHVHREHRPAAPAATDGAVAQADLAVIGRGHSHGAAQTGTFHINLPSLESERK